MNSSILAIPWRDDRQVGPVVVIPEGGSPQKTAEAMRTKRPDTAVLLARVYAVYEPQPNQENDHGTG